MRLRRLTRLTALLAVFLVIGGLSESLRASQSARELWSSSLKKKLDEIEKKVPGNKLGVYIKDLSTGVEFSHRADDYWYIASGVKVPVVLEVLRAVDAGSIQLNTKVQVTEEDYIDGAGELNFIKTGSQVSVRMLIEQALIFSDNTATDLLIRLVGLEKINALTTQLAPQAFHPITTLADVRRYAYSAFHPDAIKLPNKEFMRIRSMKDEKAKIRRLVQALKVSPTELRHSSLDSAFSVYYASRLNSATLSGYGLILEKYARGSLLKPETQSFLQGILARVETGKSRIKAGLPANIQFAHKTGTQHKRFCDMGLMSDKSAKPKELVVVACIRDMHRTEAEKQFRLLGQAISESGVFEKELESDLKGTK